MLFIYLFFLLLLIVEWGFIIKNLDIKNGILGREYFYF